MTLYEQAAAYVERGAALLDREQPGWDREIRLRTLSIESETCCVLGQLYGGYLRGLSQIKMNIWEAHRHGFAAVDSPRSPSTRTLTTVWKRLIRARRVQEVEGGHDDVAEDRVVPSLRQSGDGEPAPGEG